MNNKLTIKWIGILSFSALFLAIIGLFALMVWPTTKDPDIMKALIGIAVLAGYGINNLSTHLNHDTTPSNTGPPIPVTPNIKVK